MRPQRTRSSSSRSTSPSPSSTSPSSPRPRTPRTGWARRCRRLSEEDPSFQVHSDEETGQTVIGGQGELHLEVLVDRMLREFKVDANVGKPQVAYRETITQAVEKVECRYVRQTGGRGQYGHVVITLEPTGPGGGYEFVDKITGGVIPKEYIPSVDAGHPRGDGQRRGCRLPDGRCPGHPHLRLVPRRRQSEMAFKIAGSMAFKEAARKAKPALLEPIMAIEVVTPDEYTGRSHRRPRQPAGQGGRYGAARHHPGRPGAGASRDRCSATLPTCGRRPRAGPRRPCSSTRTSRYLPRSQKRSSPGSAANKESDGFTRLHNREKATTWPRQNSSATSPTSTWARWVTSTMARRR